MAPPIKSVANPAQSYALGADPPRQNPPSNNLWIGNVSPDVSDTELKVLFEKHGKIDSLTTYPSRNYAFVYYKEVESAKSAKQGLQGHILRGNTLKIEFAKPVEFVGGWNQSICFKEELEKEFLRYGKIQEFRFLKDRNTAYVDYFGLEDAMQALRSMNGKRIGGSQLRVDFLRSQSSRREQGPDAKEGQFPSRNMVPSDFRWMGQDFSNNYPEPSLSGSKRKNQFLPIGSQYGDAPLSNVLWIRHPPSVIIEEDMLHNAMILFGEIERIKTFSDRNYAFVEFRSVEEARQPKRDCRASSLMILGFQSTITIVNSWIERTTWSRFDAALPPESTENHSEQHALHSLTVELLENGVGADIPDVVNCSARTGLDLLSKHYDDAIGAGVAKFDDGTTLFLVPPSDFLNDVLKVPGPKRLYGVVLKFPQVVPSSTALNPQSVHPHSCSCDQLVPSHAVPPTTVAAQAGLALTPELIATLTSLLPANNGSSGSQTSFLPQMPSMLGAMSNVASGVDTNATHWKHENQALDHNVQFVQQLVARSTPSYNLHSAQAAPIVSSTTGQFHQPLNSYSQTHDRRNDLTSQGAASSKPMASVIPMQSGPVSVITEISQHYQQGSSQDVLRVKGQIMELIL
ncbi:hypothetical protein DH2020_020180 [Rehmannia glutinosa]|uniref:RRM domain-containing protein n=1 Tax=Rehmannia glutinosa TaxID=99300 RepID=A0ABR0WIA5_REHGL